MLLLINTVIGDFMAGASKPSDKLLTTLFNEGILVDYDEDNGVLNLSYGDRSGTFTIQGGLWTVGSRKGRGTKTLIKEFRKPHKPRNPLGSATAREDLSPHQYSAIGYDGEEPLSHKTLGTKVPLSVMEYLSKLPSEERIKLVRSAVIEAVRSHASS